MTNDEKTMMRLLVRRNTGSSGSLIFKKFSASVLTMVATREQDRPIYNVLFLSMP